MERTIDDRRVTLTLTSVVPAGTRLLVSWRRPSNNPLKDTVGNWVKENITLLEGSPLDARVVNSLNSPAQFPTTDGYAQRSVDENTAAGQHIGAAIAALDNDGDQLTYTISRSDAEFFDVVSTSGQLRTKEPLDREDRSTYSFTLSVTDDKDQFGFKDPAIDDTITVEVTVNDVDEPATISFSADSGTTAVDNALTVNENHAGTAATFSASDPENMAGLTYVWSLTGSDAADFNLSNSGELTFAATPDFEQPTDSGGDNVYNITVNALDSEGQTGSLTISVTVSPVDEPLTISGDGSPSIEEEGPIIVGTYLADDPENATITWLPLAGADSELFDFTTSNGRLAFKSSPDYEEANDSGGDNTYNVILSASAGGHTALFPVVVSVTNKEEPGSLILSSLQPRAEADFTATLTDRDIVQSTIWTWERSSSTSGPWSPISGASNGVTTSIHRPVADDLGFFLRVTASYADGYGPGKGLVQRSSRRVLAARGDNNPPIFNDTMTTRQIPENSSVNTPVGAPLTAMDPDSDDVLTYMLSGSGPFAIDRASGQIQVADRAALDHESAPAHTVTVTASDSSNASDDIIVTISVTDVNEPPEAIDDTVTLQEDESATFDVRINDSDPENDALSVRISRAPRHGSATVDPVTNEITYTPNTNYNGSDTLTYTVQDQHGLSDEGSVAFTITPVNDPPEFPPGPITREVARNSQADENVGDPVAAKDADGGRLMYLLSGPGASSFVINENTGQITLRDEFGDDASAQSEYTLIVEVSDESSERAEVVVKIKVVAQVTPPTTVGGGGGGGGGGPPPVPIPSDKDFDWNVTRDIESLDHENDLPTGMWSDSTILWVVENAATGADRLFAYNLLSGERLSDHEFELDRRNRFSHGIWSNGEVVWIADSGQDMLFAYDLHSGERLDERDIALAERNKDPRGIWSVGETIYVLDSVKDALFSYNLETGELLAEYPLDKLNKSPRGIWSDGVVLWVSDDGAKRIFAYRPVDGELERIEDEEFTFRSLLKAGNGNPRGIWSDGDIMYVADEQDDKVYTYNIPDASIALLGSLSLTDVDIGTFRPDLMKYSATAAPELTTTTVMAQATQEKATVVIEPDDADGDLSNGHQVALRDETTIAVTVASSDGSRVNTYEIAVRKPPCLVGLGDERLSEVTFSGGSLEALARCAQAHGVAVLLYWSGDSWLLFALGQPEFLNRPFHRAFETGVPAGTTLIAAMSKEHGRQN